MDKRKFEFYMTDPGTDNEYKLTETVDDCYYDIQDELDYFLDQFKKFLLSCGYTEISVSHLQYLKDAEWKDVLTAYGEWDDYKEKIYRARNSI